LDENRTHFYQPLKIFSLQLDPAGNYFIIWPMCDEVFILFFKKKKFLVNLRQFYFRRKILSPIGCEANGR
jgi:hypothetical protein